MRRSIRTSARWRATRFRQRSRLVARRTRAVPCGREGLQLQPPGFLRVQHGEGHEHFAGRRFRTGDPFGAFGNVQLFRWLNVGANIFKSGWQTFHDPDNPYQGRSTTGGFELTWRPNQHFNQSVSYSAVRFRRADTNLRVFDVNIINAKAVYQFDRHFLVRLVEQFDSSRRQLLTDLLASYELVPGSGFARGLRLALRTAAARRR